MDKTPKKKLKHFSLVRWLRNRFITGLIVALPIVVTIWGITSVIKFIDTRVWNLVPEVLNPATYIGFNPWGMGLAIALILILMLGAFVSNFVGNRILKLGERALARVPVVSNIYGALKQIVGTVAEQKDRAFRDVCLIEYPKKGTWAIGFVTADLQGAPLSLLKDGYVCVFVPTTPNPTSGFLLFSKRSDIKILNMTPEEGAKMIISGGMVSSNEVAEVKDPESKTLRDKVKQRLTRDSNPPS